MFPQFSEELVPGYAFLVIGFFKRLLELGLESRRQAHGRLRVLREHRDGGPFRQGHALKDDLAFDTVMRWVPRAEQILPAATALETMSQLGVKSRFLHDVICGTSCAAPRLSW